jgi:hypothetical protein
MLNPEHDTEGNSRWQPMVLMLRGGGRLECDHCGVLAVIIIGTLTPGGSLVGVDHYCQQCYLKARQEAEEEA